MLEGERSYQRGQENLVPSNNTSSAPENPVIPKAQENPWYIQHFIKLLIGFGLSGGAVSILLPWMLWLLCGMSSGSSDQLRLHLLYVTGGIIAVLTLLQTNWKNQGDRLKIDADIKKNEQDSEKNERDHIRQVHAERRSRYTKAVEQLADEKAAVRLGGIYTLVGLVDEWLADDSFKEESDRYKEGQVIVNSLCSYIRSPFPLAEKVEEYEARNELEELKKKESKSLSPLDSLRLMILNKRFAETNDEKKIEQITAGYAKIQEEQDVRRTIFAEMSKRSSTFAKDKIGKVIGTFPGMWSGFDFDFSRAPIFYPLNAITIEKGNFSSAKFYGNADFRRAIFTQSANFSRATFTQYAGFSWATFAQTANFSGATFAQTANFSGAAFTQYAGFSWVTFAQTANFSRVAFTQYAGFSWVTFAQTANFNRATFNQTANFNRATFNQTANFSGAAFNQTANYSNATFRAASPKFVETLEISGETFRARFAVLSDGQEAHNFAVYEGSQPVPLGIAGLNGVGYRIPVGTVLFDPASWDERQEEYTRMSEPAQ